MRIGLAMAALAACAVGFTALFNVSEVVSRYFFSSPLNWGGDAGAYALCATVFLALPEVTRRHAHTAVTIVLEKLPSSAGQKYKVFLMVVTALVCFVVTWFALQVAISQIDRGSLTPMANQIPRWWLTASIVAGLGLSALNFVVFAHVEPQPIDAHSE